jgi:hypothetical protein
MRSRERQRKKIEWQRKEEYSGTKNEHLDRVMDYPIVILAISLIALCLSTLAGARLSKKAGGLDEDDRADLNITLTAALTLLALMIGFAFSMAITRYNQRKDYEAVEANTIRYGIGTGGTNACRRRGPSAWVTEEISESENFVLPDR